MRVYLTGRNGLVGRELAAALSRAGAVVEGGDLPEVDIRCADTVRHRLRRFRPHWVVNLAAWTEVDACESDPARAMAVNGRAPGVVALAAREVGARLLHVSTDYVFDGSGRRPWREIDPTGPLSEYGRSKLAGEAAVRSTMPPGTWTVVRGQSLYGAGRKSFPDAILRAAAARPTLPVVTDQFVAPTWARDFAGGLALLIERGLAGTFHLSSSGHCSWNEFARAVLDEAAVAGVEVTATTAAAMARPAQRPAWSVFDLGRFERLTGRRPRHWREMLRDYLAERGRAA